MSFAKWLSLTVAGATALIGAVLVLYAHSPAFPWPDHGIAHAVFVALVGGTGAGLLHWVLMGRLTSELQRAELYVDSLAHEPDANAPYRPGLGLDDLIIAFERATRQQRRRAEQLSNQRRELEIQVRLADAERRHAEAIINSIADGVVVTDSFNEVIMANSSAARVLGFDLDDAIHQPVERLTDDDALVNLIKDTREAGLTPLPRQAEHRIQQGEQQNTFNVSLACMPGKDPARQGETAGVVTILRDVTREREIAEMKSDFVSNVSHELRTPLSSIKAYVEMLVDGEADDDETRAEFYNIIQGETNRLSRLIDNILNISRIESGVVKVQREQVALKRLIQDAIEVMQPQARAKQIELTSQITPTFFQVLADKDLIYQTTLNLLSNAIKYTPMSGKVSVSVQVDELRHEVTVSVADTGVGIPEEDLPHLFEKFYRVADHKKIAKGTGLGLNLVKHIVETVHGGRVSVHSEVNAGSTFSYTLPLADNDFR